MSHHGEFLWYDLMTTDPAAAEAFYKDVIGWGTTPFEGAPQPYTMWTADGAPIGGIMALPEDAKKAGAPPHWLAYVGVNDVAKSFDQAKQLGATPYMGPMDIPNVGQIAVFGDPQGAVLAMYQPAGASSGGAVEGPGRFSWHELMSADLDGAVSFYEKLFGWKETTTMDMGEAGPYRMYGTGPKSLGGMMRKPEQVPVSCWMYYVTVTDIEAAIAKVKARGGQLLHGPMEVPGGDHVAACMDPQGAAFALHQRNPNA